MLLLQQPHSSPRQSKSDGSATLRLALFASVDDSPGVTTCTKLLYAGVPSPVTC